MCEKALGTALEPAGFDLSQWFALSRLSLLIQIKWRYAPLCRNE